MVRLEAAALYCGLNLAILFSLSIYTVVLRNRLKITLGDGGHPEMIRACRAHGNAAEFIPGALAGLILLALFDNVSPAWALHGAGISLTLGRIAHGVGLNRSDRNLGRSAGMLLTWAAYLLLIGGLLHAAIAGRL